MEIVEIQAGDQPTVCGVLIVPILHDIPSPASAAALAMLVRENEAMLFGRLVYLPAEGALAVRSEVLIRSLTAENLLFHFGAMSQHAALAEQLEHAFHGELGPDYAGLLDGA